ncbi:MAG: 4Fe-4S dicluster domain-containing protein [Bacteriovoracaceae bacterium]|jgi:ferredoxin|nr:4Fe-4S dicluster domain-containing protein [Bacteriovoracaceae bacterium]
MLKNIFTYTEDVLSYAQNNYATGQVVTDHDLCTGCTQCVQVCPATALEMDDSIKKSKMFGEADCISCGACTAVCHTDAILISRFYNVPDGAYETQGRTQKVSKNAFPRFYGPDYKMGDS